MALTTDQMLEKIGSFGRYQIVLLIFFNLMAAMWWAVPVYLMIFITDEPGWKCKANVTSCPFTKSMRLGDDNYTYRCDIPREDWEFLDDFTSVVTQFGLVCNRGSLGFVSSSVIFAGHFLGCICVSPLSDKFGRKRTIYVCGVVLVLFNFFSALPPVYWLFALFRGVTGFMLGGFSMPMFVTATELAGKNHRNAAGSHIWYGFALLPAVLAGVAYLIRDWKTLTLVTGAPGFFILLGWFCTPESVRWLLKKRREADARKILSKVAVKNGKFLPEDPLVLPDEEIQERLGDFRDLFSSRSMTHKTLVSWILWFVTSFLGWGVAFIAPFIGGSVYVNVAVLSVAMFPAYPATWYLTHRFGRRASYVISMVLSGGGILGALLLSDKAETDTGYMAGKIFLFMVFGNFFSSIAFGTVYIHSSELFPTTVRVVGMGTSSGAARVSAFLSTFLPLLLKVHRFLPFGLMAGLAVIAAILCLTLPETRGQPTLESVGVTEKEDQMVPVEK